VRWPDQIHLKKRVLKSVFQWVNGIEVKVPRIQTHAPISLTVTSYRREIVEALGFDRPEPFIPTMFLLLAIGS
jgi:hypothetical protein